MQVEQMAEGSIPACAGEPGSELLRVIDARGSIPACAGEPDRQTRHRSSRGVYPRVCGGAGQQ